MVQEHNKAAADAWNQGGADYDAISYAVSDALAHAAQRLWAQPGERVLDIATGTGWTARNVARAGAQVVKAWTTEPQRFILNPIYQSPGLNT